MSMKKKRSDLIARMLNQNSQPPAGVGDHNGYPDEVIVMRDVHDLIPNPKNSEYSMENIEELASMIQLTHNIEPIILKAGTLMITSGHRRRLAQLYRLEHGMTDDPMVPTIERGIVNDFEEAGLTDDDMETLNIVFPNRGARRNLKPSEEAAEIAMLRPVIKKIYDFQKRNGEAEGKFRTFYADVLGISPAALQRKESLNNLAEEVKAEVDAGNITATAAAELAGLKDDEQTEVVKGIQDRGEAVTVKAVKEEKERLQGNGAEKDEVVEASYVQQEMSEPEYEPDMVEAMPSEDGESEMIQPEVDNLADENADASEAESPMKGKGIEMPSHADAETVEAIAEYEELDDDDADVEPEEEPSSTVPENRDLQEIERDIIMDKVCKIKEYCRKHDRADGSVDCEHCCLWQNGWCFVGAGKRPADWNF